MLAKEHGEARQYSELTSFSTNVQLLVPKEWCHRWGGRSVKQVRFGKLAFPQLNGDFGAKKGVILGKLANWHTGLGTVRSFTFLRAGCHAHIPSFVLKNAKNVKCSGSTCHGLTWLKPKVLQCHRALRSRESQISPSPHHFLKFKIQATCDSPCSFVFSLHPQRVLLCPLLSLSSSRFCS